MNVYTVTYIQPSWISRKSLDDPYDSFYTGRDHDTVIHFRELHAVVLDYFRAVCKEHHIEVRSIDVDDKVITVLAEGYGSGKTPTAAMIQAHFETAVQRAYTGLERLFCNYVGKAFGLDITPDDRNNLSITAKD